MGAGPETRKLSLDNEKNDKNFIMSIDPNTTCSSSYRYTKKIEESNNDFNFKKDVQPEIRKYTFVKELGRGAFGIVSLYRDKKNLNKLIAVKEFVGINESNFPKEYKKERNLLSEINHQFIVKYLFSCFDNNNFYIGLEYCENNDLEQFINKVRNKKEKFPEKFIWKVAYQTLKALEYLHIEKKNCS